jgi:hypothetical protein
VVEEDVVEVGMNEHSLCPDKVSLDRVRLDKVLLDVSEATSAL